MATTNHVTVTLQVHRSWWVHPLMWLYIVAARLGLPVDEDRACAHVARGFYVTVDGKKLDP